MTTPVSNYFDEGIAHFDRGEYARAVELFTKALRLSLGNLAEAYWYRGMSYAYLDALDRALEDFNHAIQYDPYMADAYNERGTLLRLRAEYEHAIADYNAALGLDPDHYAAYYNRALTYEKMRRYQAAEADLTQAITLNPGIAQSHEARGRIRAIMRDYDGAIADLERYLHMGGGREFDNHSEIQSFIITLRVKRLLSHFVPPQFLPGSRI